MRMHRLMHWYVDMLVDFVKLINLYSKMSVMGQIGTTHL